MDGRQSFQYLKIPLCALAAAFLWVATGAPAASAQFKLPKLPKFGKKAPEKKAKETKPSEETTPEVQGTPEIQASRHDTPEISQISPDSAPPGGSGEVVLTGKKFYAGMDLRINCKGGDPRVESLKVEDPGRAVAQISVPEDAQEGPCKPYLQYQPGASFSISKSSKMPAVIPATLLGEGDMQFAELMMKMSQEMQPGFGEGKTKQGRILVTSDSVKFVEGDKTLFAEAPSSVKEVGEMSMMGESVGGIFRIVFKNGKIYNFLDTKGGSSQHRAFLTLKKRLGK